MAAVTGVRNFIPVSYLGRNEAEGVGVHKRSRHTFGFNLRHVAGDALASRAASLVMRMFFD
jgi:hypothetical protein